MNKIIELKDASVEALINLKRYGTSWAWQCCLNTSCNDYCYDDRY